MHNILITSGGRRVSLVRAFQKEIKKIFPEAKVVVVDADPVLSPAAQVADTFVPICKIKKDNYLGALREICIKNKIKLIIPTLDTELVLLSKHLEFFREKGIDVVISKLSFIEIAKNKVETQTFFKNKGVKVAAQYAKSNYTLPLYIKPINGSSSINNYIIKEENDFSKNHFLKENLIFFEYLDHELYDEYTCDLYYNKKGILKCAIPRKRLEVRSGEVSKGLTCKNEVYDLILNKFKNLEGAKGCITAQFFMHTENKDIRGIEINPRFGGGYPLSYLAGGNFPKWIIEEYLQNLDIEFFDSWESNLLMLRYDDEILVHAYKS